MQNVVDLARWQRTRRTAVRQGTTGDRGADRGENRADDRGVDRLDRAVERLCSLVSRALDRDGAVDARTETELLAIMGEVAAGLLGDAARRTERLTDRLAVRYREREG